MCEWGHGPCSHNDRQSHDLDSCHDFEDDEQSSSRCFPEFHGEFYNGDKTGGGMPSARCVPPAVSLLAGRLLVEIIPRTILYPALLTELGAVLTKVGG